MLFLCITAAQEKYSKVEIAVPTEQEYSRLVHLGIAVDHFTGKIGNTISVYLSEREIHTLQENNIPYTVQIDDWKTFYADKHSQKNNPSLAIHNDVPKYFRYGAMGGFLTNNEVIQQLDSMRLLFPAIISARESIGTTCEGRTIFSVKIFKGTEKSEPDKPEVLYTALHHAREPEGMMTVVYFMWWLLENYGIDTEATYLVNNRQMYFIPVLNVDGYEYNRTTNPNGGGMWRKNRRNNGDGSYGVDLNRNYGPEYMWNAVNGGSSTNSFDETYRGSAPFSEPETQAIRNFVFAHNFKTCFNYHTYSNLLVYPWGYASRETEDYKIFRTWAYDLTAINRYVSGIDMQTVQYSTCGNSDDFMYGDTTGGKTKIFAMTPEVGATGFWPSTAEIIPLAQENLEMNKLLAHFAGSSVNVKSIQFPNFITPNQPASSIITFFNEGLLPSSEFSILFQNQNETAYASESILSLSSQQLFSKNVNFTASPVNSVTGTFSYAIRNFDSSFVSNQEDVIIYFGKPDTLLFDDASNGTFQWNTGSGWNIADSTLHTPFSPPYSFSDSPNGKYKSNSENSLTLLNGVSLAGYQAAQLQFAAYWEIEPSWDFAVVEVSTNNGSTWNNCRTNLMHKASARSGSKQKGNTYGYDGYTPGGDWIMQSVDLTPYAGNNIVIRFRLSSDTAEERDGWYLDDIRILAYKAMPSIVEKQNLPFSYALLQNYPNPFNPATTIFFQLPTRDFVTIKLYDIVGREVSTLINEVLEAGKHSIRLNTESLSSGIYFYKMSSGNFSSIKKMVFVK
ncbi:MAG: immune inhibitor A [Bacteroidetes bacterium]|nr:immune inhibitor A [Bacteroidota bacterium]